jgi:hypothetical protein
MKDTYGCLISVLLIISLIAFCIGMVEFTNFISDNTWNNGICIQCKERYELRGVSQHGLKYYSCPECGQEVQRY